MRQPVVVRILQGVGDRDRERHRFADGQRPCREPRRERSSLDVLEREIGLALVVPEVEETRDAGVREGGRHEGVGEEAVACRLGPCDLRRQQLQGDEAPQLVVARTVDVAEPAPPEVRLEAIRTDEAEHGRQYT